MRKTETTVLDAAGYIENFIGAAKQVILPSFEPSEPTEATIPPTVQTSGHIVTDKAEDFGKLWLSRPPDMIFLIPDFPKRVESEPSKPSMSLEAMLSTERRAILEGARALRRKIGPVPWKISRLLREMDEENA